MFADPRYRPISLSTGKAPKESESKLINTNSATVILEHGWLPLGDILLQGILDGQIDTA